LKTKSKTKMKLEIITSEPLPAEIHTRLIITYIKAGYPSPAQDFAEEKIDLNRLLIKRPSSTFLIRVSGNSMNDIIHDGDILIVDRSLEPQSGDIALCVLNGEFTVKRIQFSSNNEIKLIPENPNFPEIKIKENDDFQVWGVITYIIRKAK